MECLNEIISSISSVHVKQVLRILEEVLGTIVKDCYKFRFLFEKVKTLIKVTQTLAQIPVYISA
jgi:hypothetical protein